MNINPLAFKTNFYNFSPENTPKKGSIYGPKTHDVFCRTQKPVKFGNASTSGVLSGEMTPEKYKKLTEKEKIELRGKYRNFHQEFIEAFGKNKVPGAYSMLLYEDPTMAYITKEAEKINKNYKDHNVYVLGRNSAVVLETAKAMKDGIKDYGYAGFSQMITHKDPDFPEIGFRKTIDANEKHEKIRQNLRKKRLMPVDLIENYKKTGKPTIFINYVQGGNRIQSFQQFLMEEAKKTGQEDEIKKAIKMHLLYIPCISCDESEKLGFQKSYNTTPEGMYSVVKNEFLNTFFGENAENARSTEITTDEQKNCVKEFNNLVKFSIYDYLASQKLLK